MISALIESGVDKRTRQVLSASIHDTVLVAIARRDCGILVFTFGDDRSGPREFVVESNEELFVFSYGLLLPHMFATMHLYAEGTSIESVVADEQSAFLKSDVSVYCKPGGWLLALSASYGSQVFVYGSGLLTRLGWITE